MPVIEREDYVGAACIGCLYGVAGVFPGDGGPPVDDDGRAMTYFEGEWRCHWCMEDVRWWRRALCEAATARARESIRAR